MAQRSLTCKSVSFTIETFLFLVTDLDMNLTKNKFELNTSASGEKSFLAFYKMPP